MFTTLTYQSVLLLPAFLEKLNCHPIHSQLLHLIQRFHHLFFFFTKTIFWDFLCKPPHPKHTTPIILWSNLFFSSKTFLQNTHSVSFSALLCLLQYCIPICTHHCHSKLFSCSSHNTFPLKTFHCPLSSLILYHSHLSFAFFHLIPFFWLSAACSSTPPNHSHSFPTYSILFIHPSFLFHKQFSFPIPPLTLLSHKPTCMSHI